MAQSKNGNASAITNAGKYVSMLSSERPSRTKLIHAHNSITGILDFMQKSVSVRYTVMHAGTFFHSNQPAPVSDRRPRRNKGPSSFA